MKRKNLIIFLVVALIFFVVALILSIVLSSRNTLKDIEQIFVNNSYTFNVERSDNNILAGERYNATLNDNLNLQIFIYGSKENANIDANRISPDGYSYSKTVNEEVTVSHIDWIGPPHFYKFKNAIILYIGNNQDLLNLLSAKFGEQIAGLSSSKESRVIALFFVQLRAWNKRCAIKVFSRESVQSALLFFINSHISN